MHRPIIDTEYYHRNWFKPLDDCTVKRAYFQKWNSLRPNIDKLVLDERLCTMPVGVITVKSNFLFELIEDVMQRIIPMGIPMHLFEFDRWVKFLGFFSKNFHY